jgi:uncharacterized spore protein YtfJ
MGGHSTIDEEGRRIMPTVDELLKGHREAITVKRVFGDPYEKDGVTVIPAAKVIGGGGGGEGEAPEGQG